MFAVTNKTAAEIVMSRADSQAPNMGLTSWEGNKVHKQDIIIAKDRHAFGELYEIILKELPSACKSGEFYTPRAITEFIGEMMNPQIFATL